jgi:hypothetical protein
MKANVMMPSVVDFAYEVISMHNKIIDLEYELAHKEELLKIQNESLNRSAEHSKNMLCTMIGGILDPESSINKGDRAIQELATQKEAAR